MTQFVRALILYTCSNPNHFMASDCLMVKLKGPPGMPRCDLQLVKCRQSPVNMDASSAASIPHLYSVAGAILSFALQYMSLTNSSW